MRRLIGLLIFLGMLVGCADESARPTLGPAIDEAPTTETASPSPGITAPSTTSPLEGLEPLDGFDTAVLRVFNEGGSSAHPVLYAATIEARRQGLMEVTDLQGFTGMVFVFEADTEAAFWMRNTPMPLSIVFVRADGSIVSISDMEPCADVDTCPTYPPTGPYRFALEVPQGRLPALGISTQSLLGID